MMNQIHPLPPAQARTISRRSLTLQTMNALALAALCVVSAALLCMTMIYLAAHTIVPALAPIRGSERVGVWYRFSRLAIREIESWRHGPSLRHSGGVSQNAEKYPR